ncbi:MAG: hypothetical protein KC978_14970 [Candidatus Omnitrophica bacterium]|nr:hypothetical protein [Candidatus Omnitrophota bacterium]
MSDHLALVEARKAKEFLETCSGDIGACLSVSLTEDRPVVKFHITRTNMDSALDGDMHILSGCMRIMVEHFLTAIGSRLEQDSFEEDYFPDLGSDTPQGEEPWREN